MSISGFLSSTFNPQPPAGATNPYQQQLQQLSQALTSGNLSAAQSDFATLQKAFTQSSTTGSASSSPSANPVTQAFNQLASDLQSGNLAAAQKDFSTLKLDAKTYGAPPTSHSWGFNKFNGGGSSADPIRCFRASPNLARVPLPQTNLARSRLTPACSNSFSSTR